MKNVIITGSANGVGKAIANVLKEEKLILIDVDENNLKQVAEETKSKYYICDISDDKQVANVINDINMDYEKIDCLINCAGMWISGDISKLDQPIYNEMNELGRIKKVIDTNVFGTVAMIKSIFPIMKSRPSTSRTPIPGSVPSIMTRPTRQNFSSSCSPSAL